MVGLPGQHFVEDGDGFVVLAVIDQGHATVEQSATFLDAYVQARGCRWTSTDREAAWAAGLWVRAFDAKAAAQHGDPDAVLTRSEARARLELAGLGSQLV